MFSMPPSASAFMRPQVNPLERRRHRRVALGLLGRYMLTNRNEYPCRSIDISPGGVALIAPVKGGIGERVVLYLEHIGRLEGEIIRHLPDGFAMSVAATPRKRDKVADQLTWLVNRHTLGLPEDRRHERFSVADPRSTLTLPTGVTIPCRIIDVSLSGAAIATTTAVAPGTPVIIGRTHGRVVRQIEGGFAIEFSRVQNPDMLEHDLGGTS
jgi:hypothetical protein